MGYLVKNLNEDKPIIHFLFVKEIYCCMGVATLLLEKSQIDLNNSIFTHWTMPVDDIIKKFDKMTYNPYKL